MPKIVIKNLLCYYPIEIDREMEIDTIYTRNQMIYIIRDHYLNINTKRKEGKYSPDLFSDKFWKRFVGGQKAKHMDKYLDEKIEDPTPFPELDENQEKIADMLCRMVRVEELINYAGDSDDKLCVIIDTVTQMDHNISMNDDIYMIHDVYDDDEMPGGDMYYINRIPGNRPIDIEGMIKTFYQRVVTLYTGRVINMEEGDERDKRIGIIKKGEALFPYLDSLEISDRDKYKMINNFYRENGM